MCATRSARAGAGARRAGRASAAAGAAIFLRFVRTGTTHSGDGNGCGNGRWSLSFHACGSRSVIRGDEQGKVPIWPLGPRATAVPVLSAQGCLPPETWLACLFLRPRCGLRFVTLRGRPAGDSIPGTDNSAELLISLLLFCSRAQWPLQRETSEGLCCPMTASTALSHCHHYPIRTGQLGNCSVAILKFFREVSLPLILDPSIPTQ